MSTASDKNSRQPGDDYDVGYRKPPVATRFEFGNQAARKKGRPKGRKNKATVLREIAEMQVEVTLPGGVRKKRSLWEAGALKHAVNAAKGDVRSWGAFNQLLERYGVAFDTPADLPVDPEEELAVADFFQAWARANPEQANALLEELAPTPPPDNAPNRRASQPSTGSSNAEASSQGSSQGKSPAANRKRVKR